MSIRVEIITAFIAVQLIGCASGATSLREAANGRIFIGAAVNIGHIGADDDGNYSTVASREYDLVTAENECKWSATEPEQNTFDFSACDGIETFAVTNNMAFRGHNLCWGSYNPQWLEDLDDSSKREALINHVTQVASHYGPSVVAWDVVNEAVDDSSTGGEVVLKNSTWYPSVPDFISTAFDSARMACSDCSLFYNDYSIASATGWMQGKSDAVYSLVSGLLAAGVPIDGVGFQLHVSLDFDDFQGVAQNIQRLGALGLKVHFTEIDVSCGVYSDDYACPSWGDAEAQTQADIYAGLLKVCLSFGGVCESFETWGFTDKYTWLTSTNNGTDEHPLPFDENYAPKAAYNALLDTLLEQPTK